MEEAGAMKKEEPRKALLKKMRFIRLMDSHPTLEKRLLLSRNSQCENSAVSTIRCELGVRKLFS